MPYKKIKAQVMIMAKHYQPSAVLRDNAKGFLNGKYSSAVRTTLIYIGISWLVLNMFNEAYLILLRTFVNFKATGTVPTVILFACNFIGGGLLMILLSVVNVGLSFYYLEIGTGNKPPITDMFYGFREDFKKNLTASVLINLPLIFSTLPGMIAQDLYTNTSDKKYLVAAIVLYIAGYALYLFFNISFKLTYYILADFPEYTALMAVKAAWKKISGHRGRLFGLMFSFIPYYILIFLSFGIGILWLYPLMQESYVQFYLDLMNPKEVSGEWERTV